MNSFKKLIRAQIQESLHKLLDLAKCPVPKVGWVRMIRNALGMSSYVLARKMHMSQSNVIRMEKSERAGTITLKTLEAVAAVMNCKLVYCLVPLTPLEEMREEQARIIAKERIARVNQSMSLEQQGLTPKQMRQEEDDLVKELLQGNPKDLWG